MDKSSALDRERERERETGQVWGQSSSVGLSPPSTPTPPPGAN